MFPKGTNGNQRLHLVMIFTPKEALFLYRKEYLYFNKSAFIVFLRGFKVDLAANQSIYAIPLQYYCLLQDVTKPPAVRAEPPHLV